MSLGTWFRDYVYIPLGGNRVSQRKWYRNILVVWLFTGIWHGAAWTFVIWGLFFCALLIIEKKWLLPYLKKVKVWNHVYVLFLLIISFMIFNGENVGAAIADIGRLFGAGGISLYTREALYYGKSFLVLILVAVVLATPAVSMAGRCLYKKFPVLSAVLKIAGLLLLFLLSTAYLVDGSFNPFLYFRF